MSNKEGVDALVKEYLVSRGYVKAAAELEIESQSTTSSKSLVSRPIAQQMLSNVAEDLYILGIKDGDAASYIDGYDSLRSWALDSIDLAKAQLLSLTYPIFIHCYLGLIRLGFVLEAQAFFDNCHQDHSEYHFEEMQYLATLSTAEQLQSSDFLISNPFISCALKYKFIVRITSLAYNLLALYLVQSDLVLIASIINTKVQFKKLSDSQLTTVSSTAPIELEEISLVELQGYSIGAATTVGFITDFPPIPLGVPGSANMGPQQIDKFSSNIMYTGNSANYLAANSLTQNVAGGNYSSNTPAITTNTAANCLVMPNVKDDSVYKDLVDKIARPRSILAKLTKRMRILAASSASSQGVGTSSGGYYEDYDDNDNEQQQNVVRSIFHGADRLGASSSNSKVKNEEDTADDDDVDADESNYKGSSRSSNNTTATTTSAISDNSSIGNALEPCIIFATVTNTYEGMTCMHINNTVTQLATGHRDSCVRVWRLDDNNNSNNNSSSRNRGGRLRSTTTTSTAGTLSTPHFGRLLRRRNRSGSIGSSSNDNHTTTTASASSLQWEMKEVLPKTKQTLRDEATGRKTKRGSSGSSCYNEENDNSNSNGLSVLELRGHSRAVYGVSQDISNCGYGSYNNNYNDSDLISSSATGTAGANEDRLVLSCSADETIRLWDLAVAQCVGKYTCVSPAWAVSFSPLGYHFAAGNQDNTATIFATDRIAPIRLLTGHVSDVNCLAWHGNATLLATGSDDKTARLWDVRSGWSARLLRGCSSPISSIAISPQGTLLAAGCDSGRIYMWDLLTSKPIAILQGHQHDSVVHSVSFSADSSALSSGGADCSVRVWDLQEIHSTQNKLVNSSSSSNNIIYPSVTINNNNGMFGLNNNNNVNKQINSTNARHAAASLLDNIPQVVLRPKHSFFTKFSPVYYTGYTTQNMLYAGGPFSLSAATASQQSGVTVGTVAVVTGEGIGADRSGSNSSGGAVSEQDTVSALGISRAVQSFK